MKYDTDRLLSITDSTIVLNMISFYIADRELARLLAESQRRHKHAFRQGTLLLVTCR